MLWLTNRASQNLLRHASSPALKMLWRRCASSVALVTAFVVPAAAQAQEKVEMADVMRSNGKIYVVVGIILLVLAGLFIYLFSLDRKISALEKKLPDGRKNKL